MIEFECPGLLAKWLNGWLAAVGATVLDPRIRLRWSSNDAPVAVLCASDVDPLESLVESWPTADLLNDLPIARRWPQATDLTRDVSVDVFRERSRMVRERKIQKVPTWQDVTDYSYSWALSSTLTDLDVDKERVKNAPFDPPAPRGRTLHDRLTKLHGLLEGYVTRRRVQDSLIGLADREKANGLGFDHTRIGSLADDTTGKQRIDPMVEVLAFFGLAILPMRGNGTAGSGQQRGWRPGKAGANRSHFTWPAWTKPLDCHGIDAMLDAWQPDFKSTWARLGVHAGWQTVGFISKGKSDPTKAYGAERL